jgi:hypothetical protein
MGNGFEEIFAPFILGIGGEILPGGPEERADYIFRRRRS